MVQNANITLKNVQIQQVKEFCYLGSLLTDDNKATKDISKQITLFKQIFEKKWRLLTNKNFSIISKKKCINKYIWNIL